ncbi:MAG: hypothetical protein IPP60_02455 [Sphingobacteriales bacterium]|jgi:hypothetical protein|nr:hypothetical protein [Saprospirales bacterium]MBK9791980.1 hypothetical protein [Sphingobacteriales bacterium]
MCIHLKSLEDFLKSENIAEVYRGQVWSKNCREWIYYDAILNPQKLKEKFHFDATIIIHDYKDNKVGSELGLVCTLCNDAIMGVHPKSGNAENNIKIN